MQKIHLNPNWKYKETFPTISAYTTLFNCIKGNYPFEEAIRSFAWADEIVAVDGGSTDGTKERLEELKKELPNLVVYDIPLSENPGKDGELKAMSRAMCMSEYLVQFDSDEICLGDPLKWKKIVKSWHPEDKILSLPVLEPIGSLTNLRMNTSHTPWKWRISISAPEITHGISRQNQNIINGTKYSKGSDGCEPIHIVSEDMIPHRLDSNAAKMTELKSNKNKKEYKEVVENLLKNKEPAILHLGHVNLHKKIKLYLDSWRYWWYNLYNKDPNDPANNEYFPGIRAEDVTEEMINEKVKKLIEETPSIKIKELESCLVKKD